MVHRAYTFRSVEFQVGMSDSYKCQKFEDWLVSRLKNADDKFEDGILHCKNHIDFRNKPHMAYDFIAPDGCKNYIVMCGESPHVMRDCLLKYMEMTNEQNTLETENTIKW